MSHKIASILLLHILVSLLAGIYLHKMSSSVPSTFLPQATEVTSASSIASDMSPAEFRIYNRLAEQMAFYHSHLRGNWNELYAGTEPGKRSPPTSAMIKLGLQFCQHLKGHHDIEETFWFPRLGKKMPGFRPGDFATTQHKEMHKGLDKLMLYLEECRSGARDLRRQEVRDIMDSFGKVLWTHLDEEVAELGAENMRKYWTKEEMRSFPF